MTSDFDNDEIKDSAFPVEFTDDTSLDMYGVWVKNGPRDASKARPEPDAKQGAEDRAESETVSLADLSEFDKLPDIPDFEPETAVQEQPEEPATEINPEPETITFEEIETVAIPPSAKEPEATPETVAPARSESVFNSVDANEFLVDLESDKGEPKAGEADTIGFTEEILDADIAFEDIPADELDRSSGSGLDLEPVPDFSEGEPEAGANAGSFEALSLEDLEPLPETGQAEPGLAGTDAAAGQTLPDDEFSSFLDDLNAGNAKESPGTAAAFSDNLDLDSFVDSFNESGNASHEEEKKLYDDVEPIDLELEFDESFIEDAEKIRATGSAISESEFFNSEFGVELIDETSDESESSLIAAAGTSVEAKAEIPEMGVMTGESPAVSFEETSEFDDLLESLEGAPAPAQPKSETAGGENRPHGFDLKVTEEDGFDTLNASVAETSALEDIEVPLFDAGSADADKAVEPAAAEENLDIPVIRDYNDTKSGKGIDHSVVSVAGEHVSPDFDDISAVEQELSDLTPDTGDETVVTNDKSTELLMIIADELSSIKKEISTLKSEISSFKNAGVASEPVIPSEIDKANENSGFFSDDDTDETIALTGDELNNILITADFTEEKNEADESLTPSGEAMSGPAVEAPAESIQESPKEAEIPETLPDSIFEVPQFDSVSPIEVSHINTVEEDMSYLEGSDAREPGLDDVAIEEPELETIDFDDEKLEEPKLEEFNIDLSDIENSFSAGQNVPVPEAESAVTSEAHEPLTSGVEAPVAEPPALEEAVFEEPVLEDIPLQPESVPAVEEKLAETPVAPETVGALSGDAEAPEPENLSTLPVDLKNEIKSVLTYMDQLLESLPEEKIEEFARSEHFDVYKKLFEELGIS